MLRAFAPQGEGSAFGVGLDALFELVADDRLVAHHPCIVTRFDDVGVTHRSSFQGRAADVPGGPSKSRSSWHCRADLSLRYAGERVQLAAKAPFVGTSGKDAGGYGRHLSLIHI